MTPSSLTLRLLLVRVTATGDSPVVKHSRYRHEFLKSLSGALSSLKEDPSCLLVIHSLFRKESGIYVEICNS
jgi:hypothetical protein